MVEIKPQDQELGFDGTNIEQFLESYQLAAEWDGASEYDMAHQICFFMCTEELMDVVEVMDGYEDHDWTTLKVSMLAYWKPVDEHQFTLQDLDVLLRYWSEKEGIAPAEDYPFFCESFETIVSFLLRNNDRIGLEEIQDLCYEAFSVVLKSVHGSSSDSIPNRINHEINLHTTADSITCLTTHPTGFRDALSKPALDLDRSHQQVEPRPFVQASEEPREAIVLLLPPVPSPIQPSLFQSEACLETDVENDHLDALDSSLHEFPNPQVPDIPIFELLTINPSVKEENKILASRHQVKRNLEDSVACFIHLASGHNISASDSHSPYPIDLLHEECGEDHNYFIDQLDPSSCSFDTQSQDNNLVEDLNIIRIPVNLKFFPSDLVIPLEGSLRDENKLPMFCFEEEDTSFSNHFSDFELKTDQDPSFQDSLQDPQQDKNQLLSFHLKNKDSFQEPASSFQDRPRNEGKLLLFQVVGGQGTAVGCQRSGKKGLISLEAKRLEVSPLLSVHLRVDTSQVVKTLRPATFVSHAWPPFSFNRMDLFLPTIVDHRGKIGQPSFQLEKVVKLFQEHGQEELRDEDKLTLSHRKREFSVPEIPQAWTFWPNEFSLLIGDLSQSIHRLVVVKTSGGTLRSCYPPTVAFQFMNKIYRSELALTESYLDLEDQHSLLDTLSCSQDSNLQKQPNIIMKFRPVLIFINLILPRGSFNPHLDHLLCVLLDRLASRNDLTSNIKSHGLSATFTQDRGSQPPLIYHSSLLSSFSQNDPIESVVPISSDYLILLAFSKETGHSLVWNRSGIGPDHVFPSGEWLRNEDKLLSFHWNSRGSIFEEALLTKIFIFVFWSIGGPLSKSWSIIKVGKSSTKLVVHRHPISIAINHRRGQ
ncbi:hypothetical protein Pst134EA_015279 [Puccinia striiformis f. sp. tritici]|uniref:hypothetical protein n=1 Tax=Puccinia striiformis f. sp. tritici TaxID=168172 RepID=UPI002007DA24|nr:hypothetical protein Pst134EA_015279 [Puccinia striiformis f. sp. tritici]KAH9463196.1 hypothetical protein Pst134EA_015279 [Puccinia striiformis f. sp. tritici]